MKKGLSVLLILAALFGFYGGAVNIKDVMAAKAYWEDKSEQTTADLNKLEDGLKTLDENKEAYLEGLDKVKDGEEALVEGEQELAEGEATLAQGEADYAAAPGKLADARRQLAEGEEALAEGEESLKKLSTAITGVNQLLSGYNNTWRPGYETLKGARKKIYQGSKGSKKSLVALSQFLSSKDAYLAAVEDVASDNGRQNAKDYKDFIKSTNELAKDIPKIQKKVKEVSDSAKKMLAALKVPKTNFDFAGVVSKQKSALKQFAAFIEDKEKREKYLAGIDSIADAYDSYDKTVEQYYQAYLAGQTGGKPTVEQMVEANMEKGWDAFWGTSDGKAAITGTKTQILQSKGIAEPTQEQINSIPDETAKSAFRNSGSDKAKAAEAGIRSQVTEQVKAGVKEEVKKQVKAAYESNKELTAGKAGLIDAMQQISDGLADVNEQVNGKSSKLKNKLLPGLKQFNAAATSKKVDKLTEGQNNIAGGVATIASGVLNNSTLRAGVKNAMGSKALVLLRRYSGGSSPAYSKNSNFAKFESQMDSNPGLISILQKARKFLGNTRADGLSTYNDGLAKLKAGRAQYAQGLADYEAAPAKLEAGRLALEEGRQKLADGRKELAAGKEKLAEYEDGERQVRDGLATLMASDRYADLETILERRNGDDNFDDADKHLNIPEGLDAVGTGREYQADTGAVVTKELTGRILGSGLGLGAAVIALLAALLSLMKKYKGAAALAVATAAVGIGGMIAGNNAGMEMSSIAGSNMGATPMVAAGILAVVAALFSIVHFTAKKES